MLQPNIGMAKARFCCGASACKGLCFGGHIGWVRASFPDACYLDRCLSWGVRTTWRRVKQPPESQGWVILPSVVSRPGAGGSQRSRGTRQYTFISGLGWGSGFPGGCHHPLVCFFSRQWSPSVGVITLRERVW